MQTQQRGRLQLALVGALAVTGGCYDGLDDATMDTAPGGSGGIADATGPGGQTGSDTESGSDSQGETEESDTDGVPAGCDANAVPVAKLIRMNKQTYVRALEDVFGEPMIGQLDAVLAAMPSIHGGVFATETLAPSYAEVAASVNTAFLIATRLTLDDTALSNLAACLPAVPAGADPQVDACLAGIVDNYGRRLLRRPLTDEDRTRLFAEYAVGGEQSVSEGVATLLTALLIDPEFLYFSEVGGEDDGTGILQLTPHETAARLARVLWSSIPDEQLLAAADSGLDDATLRAEVERMLDDPRAHGAVSGFFRDWLELERIPFASDEEIPDAEDRIELRDAMESELLAFTSSTILDGGGAYADLILDRTTFVDSPALADLYGVPPSAAGQPLPAEERAGLLTRAGFLATPEIRDTNAGHIIKRGARLSSFICRPLPLPDADNFPQEDPAEPGENPTQSIRERFAAATAEATCAVCHVQLDGLGAPMGHFGNLGQWIDAETVETAGGDVDLPINTDAEFLLDGVPVAVSDPIAFSEALAASSEAPRCMAENLTRNMLARPLTEDDECLVDTLGNALAGDAEAAPASVRDALVDFVTSNLFRKVRTQ